MHGKAEVKKFIRIAKYEDGTFIRTVWCKKRTFNKTNAEALKQTTTVQGSRSVDSEAEANSIQKLMLEEYSASDRLGIVMHTPDPEAGVQPHDQAAIEGGEKSAADSEEPDEAELVNKSVKTGHQKIAELDKQILALMADMAATGNTPRTRDLMKAAGEHRKIMETHKTRLQADVTKKKASKTGIDALIVCSDQHIHTAKDMHSEFKPHVKAAKQ